APQAIDGGETHFLAGGGVCGRAAVSRQRPLGRVGDRWRDGSGHNLTSTYTRRTGVSGSTIPRLVNGRSGKCPDQPRRIEVGGGQALFPKNIRRRLVVL